MRQLAKIQFARGAVVSLRRGGRLAPNMFGASLHQGMVINEERARGCLLGDETTALEYRNVVKECVRQ